MNLLSWTIVIVPLIAILGVAFYSRHYVRGVADYLAAGRVAGRYVISVGDLQCGLGVITLVALVEEQYQCGLGLGFWSGLTLPVSMVLALTGYCVYRFRETRALSLGQFLEMRYSRRFRIFAATLRTVAEMMTNAIGPAIAARFFIYFLGFPHEVSIFGCAVPTFAFLMALVLTMAMAIIWPGGRVSLIITDCIQGLISYPIFVIFAVYVLCKVSFLDEVAPMMLDRVPGESFLNPFDISKLRDFNIFALVVAIIANIVNRASWIGNDTGNSGRTPHEQKMAGILGTWRNGFAWLMCLLIGVVVFTMMNHGNFAGDAKQIRDTLTTRISAEVIPNPEVRGTVMESTKALAPQIRKIGVDRPLSREDSPDSVYLDTVKNSLEKQEDGNAVFQQFRTLYYQMMMPVTLQHMFPPVLMGLFCLLMVLLMLSTDDSRIFNASSTIIQDVIMPLRKEPFTKEQHLKYLRVCSVGVCVFFFTVSLFLAQLDYINMFITIMTSIWLGGAGPVMVFGLYSRFGTTAGAWASLLTGSGISVGGLLLQRNWADHIYPMLDAFGWTGGIDSVLRLLSGPFHPYIVWEMDPVKFPINSKEIYFFAMISGILSYLIVSWLTCKKPFNLDRMLHRGAYSLGETKEETVRKPWWSPRTFYDMFVGITPEYTRGDKIITWTVLGYSIGYQFLIAFVGVLIWNMISPFPAEWWSWYFFINNVVIAAVIGGVSTVWFLIGGIIDMKCLFRDLAARKDNPLDDGWVDGHVSAADRDLLPKDSGSSSEE